MMLVNERMSLCVTDYDIAGDRLRYNVSVARNVITIDMSLVTIDILSDGTVSYLSL